MSQLHTGFRSSIWDWYKQKAKSIRNERISKSMKNRNNNAKNINIRRKSLIRTKPKITKNKKPARNSRCQRDISKNKKVKKTRRRDANELNKAERMDYWDQVELMAEKDRKRPQITAGPSIKLIPKTNEPLLPGIIEEPRQNPIYKEVVSETKNSNGLNPDGNPWNGLSPESEKLVDLVFKKEYPLGDESADDNSSEDEENENNNKRNAKKAKRKNKKQETLKKKKSASKSSKKNGARVTKSKKSGKSSIFHVQETLKKKKSASKSSKKSGAKVTKSKKSGKSSKKSAKKRCKGGNQSSKLGTAHDPPAHWYLRRIPPHSRWQLARRVAAPPEPRNQYAGGWIGTVGRKPFITSWDCQPEAPTTGMTSSYIPSYIS